MRTMPWEYWPSRWAAALEACQRLGGDARPLVVAGPASEADVRAVEREIGIRIPEGFRTVLTRFSAKVEMDWQLENFIASTGGLDPDSGNAQFWRRWFGLGS